MCADEWPAWAKHEYVAMGMSIGLFSLLRQQG
jgi:hypothetical protein